ncbi:gametocyte-specific factor 1 [Paralichthys olivaceus]|uniref:gametocyte-specific factor 1 n=1 Tax=Paralichthys olivaceus TaxID=8255 RepID=UPI00097DE3A1|nr:PREDICTED: gametocyte-specific factor 1-like [Paralichthys olivaceus]XP_019960293.1 PREDICTED: gametocyte-specific factor 1-like [Paralichthys olivaceus]
MANMFKFGNTIGPCRTGFIEGAQRAEETDEKGSLDPDRLLQCPFDKNHQIRVCRFPYHLIKCRKNHPKLARELKTCPFNACHLVPRHELTRHTETCENRISLDPAAVGESTNGHVKWQVPASTWVNPNMVENWDEEIDDEAPTFTWGKNTALNQKPNFATINGPSLKGPGVLPGPLFNQ